VAERPGGDGWGQKHKNANDHLSKKGKMSNLSMSKKNWPKFLIYCTWKTSREICVCQNSPLTGERKTYAGKISRRRHVKLSGILIKTTKKKKKKASAQKASKAMVKPLPPEGRVGHIPANRQSRLGK